MISDARTWTPSTADKVYLDANAWIYAFNPFNGQNQNLVKVYSELLKDLISSKCEIYYCSLVLSEIVNTCLRISYETHLAENNLTKKELKFKQYRSTEECSDALQMMGIYLRFLYRVGQPLYRDATLCGYMDVIDKFTATPSDINDIIIAHTCKNKGISVITHDTDMASTQVDIITFNRRMLCA